MSEAPYQKYIMHHVGIAPGGGGTTRVNLWFDADPIEPLMSHLDRLVDAFGIEGIVGVVRTSTISHVKAQLIVQNRVDVAKAAAVWIERFNAHITQQPGQVLASLANTNSLRESMVTYSSTRTYHISED